LAREKESSRENGSTKQGEELCELLQVGFGPGRFRTRTYRGDELSERASSKKKSLLDNMALVPGLMDGKSMPKPSSSMFLPFSFSPPPMDDDTTEVVDDGWIKAMDLGVAKKSMRS
jgi:hypothetical protein